MKRRVILLTFLFFIGSSTCFSEENAQSLYEKGFALNEQGKLNEAITYFEKAIELDPNLAKAYFELAYDYDFLGKKDKAIPLYEKGLSLDASFVPAYIMLANCYVQERRDLVSAHRLAKRALEIEPANGPARQILEATELKIKTFPGGEDYLRGTSSSVEQISSDAVDLAATI